MRVKVKGITSISINGAFIKLGALLKFAGLVSSGVEAKFLIQTGNVFVNGKTCFERGKKIKTGDIVKFDNNIIRISSLNSINNGRLVNGSAQLC